ncbi:MAG: PQQ-binding-like beta-propeller repeat protein [Candidatus Bathyarchaeota archaeon]|nr:PQQ-binding-like beta-propeller repeat protein [Candidatus Bathyarchaeota archaeon]
MRLTKTLTSIVIAALILSCFITLYKAEPATAVSSNGTINFNVSGLAAGTSWTVQVQTTNHTQTSSTYSTSWIEGVPCPWIVYVPAGYTSSSTLSGTAYVAAYGTTNINVAFTAIPGAYDVVFTQTGLASGTRWSVTLNGNTQTSTTDTVTFSGVSDGSYSYFVNAPGGYNASVTFGAITVDGENVEQSVLFTSQSDSWSMFGNGPARTASSTSIGPLTNSLAWSKSTGQFGEYYLDFSPAVVVGDVFYICSGHYVYALNAFTGDLINTYDLGSTYNDDSGPAMVEDILYFGSSGGNVTALNITSGDIVWTYTTGSYITGSPVVANGVLYIGSYDDKLYALNATNGNLVWSYNTGADVWTSPAVSNGLVLVYSNGKLYAINAQTGSQAWNYSVASAQYYNDAPVVQDGIVYGCLFQGSGAGAFFALNVTSGAEIWSYSAYSFGGAAVANGVVYFNDGDDGYLRALNATTGVGIWSRDLSLYDQGPMVSGDVVYVVSYNGIYALNATTGNTIWSYSFYNYMGSDSGTPIIANGIVYVFVPGDMMMFEEEGTIYAFGNPEQYTLNMTTVGQGTVEPGNQTYNAGSTVNLVAIPDAGWSFSGWSGDASGTTNTTLSMDGNKTVTATFTQDIYALTMLTVGNGQVNPGNTSATYRYGDTVDIKAINDAGWSFSGWSGDASGTSNTTLMMDGNLTVTATFTLIPTYDVTFTCTGLALGTSWNVTLDGSTQTSTAASITFTGLLSGNYAYTIGAVADYTLQSLSSTGTLPVNTDLDIPLAFTYNLDWPMFGYDLARCGSSPVNGPATNYTKWIYTTGGVISSSPSIYGGVVYVGSNDGYLYAFNESDGNILWTYKVSGIIQSSSAVANGVVYIGSSESILYALNASTGTSIWNFTAGNVIYSSPAVANGIVYVGCYDKNLYAINASTGALVWSYTTGGPIDLSSPAIVNGVVFIGSTDSKLYAINASTGAKLWSSDLGGAIYSTPAVANGLVFVGTEGSKIYALNATTGDECWQLSTGGAVYCSAAVDNGVVYIGSYDKKMYALNASTGAEIWSFTVDGYILAKPSIASGVIYFGSFDGQLYALNATDGEAIWSYQTDAIYVSPAVTDGSLYVGSSNNNIIAFSAPQVITLTMNTVGHGTVQPGNGTQLYGSTIDLQAIPDEGWSFAGWSGDASGTSNTTLMMDGNKTITATFSKDVCILTMITKGKGSVLPGNVSYLYGDSVDLKAIADAGWSFANWTGSASGTSNTTITMTGNFTVTATFTQDTYTLTIITVGQGSVTNANTTFLSGTTVDLSATGSTGWHFANWTGDLSGSVNPSSILMDGDKTVVASFAKDVCILTMVTVGSGSVLPGNVTYLYGDSVDLKAINNAGWTFANWTGSASGTSNTTLTMTGNLTVTATFTQNIYTLTIITVGQGTVTPGNSSYLSGATVDLKAFNAAHWTFANWTGGASGTSNTTITLNGDMTITATFTKITYVVNFAASGASSDYVESILIVDGTEYPLSALPLSFTWDSGSTHTYSYASLLSVNSGKRYAWASASGLSTLQGGTLTVSGEGTVTANYGTQYLLVVSTPYGSASGSGWYSSGSSASASISGSTYGSGDTRQVFTGWSNGQTGTSFSVTMDSAKSVRANWATQYLVTLTANPTEAGSTTPQTIWASAGTISISASANSGYRFASWTVEGSATIASAYANSTSAAISGPANITANFNSGSLIATVTTSGETYDVTLSGDIASNQMSNITITPHQSKNTTTVGFTVTGESGTSGTGNLTLSKSAIPYGTTPLVYVDGVLVEEQGYTEDADNYYIWYTVHFSSHEMTIEFTSTQNAPDQGLGVWLGVGAAALLFAVLLVLIVLFKRSKPKRA